MQFLRQAYPLHAGRRLLKIMGLVFLAGFLFEYIFLPFNVNQSEHLFRYEVICTLHSANGAITYGIFFLLLGRFVREEHWKLYKEIIAIFVVLTVIGVNNFFLRRLIYDNAENASMHYLLEEIGHAYLVGPLLFLGITLSNFFLLNASHMRQAQDLTVAHTVTPSAKSEGVRLVATVKNDHFDLIPDNLLYVKADGNYAVFFVKTAAGVEQLMKRMTLQSTLDQLTKYPFIIRTHRAYVVNVRYVDKVTGNAQGYQLILSGADEQVPVSRMHLKSFNKQMS